MVCEGRVARAQRDGSGREWDRVGSPVVKSRASAVDRGSGAILVTPGVRSMGAAQWAIRSGWPRLPRRSPREPINW